MSREAVLKMQHGEDIIRLAQDREERKVGCATSLRGWGGGGREAGCWQRCEGRAPLPPGDAAGAAEDGVAACADHNSEHSKLLTSSQSPVEEPGPGAPAPQETGDAHRHGGE